MDKPLHVEGYKLAGMNNIFLFVELQTTWDVVEVRPKRSHVLVGEVVRGKFMACLIFTKEEPHPDLQAALPA